MSAKLEEKIIPRLRNKLDGVVPTLLELSLLRYLDDLETEVRADLMLKSQRINICGITSLIPTLKSEIDSVLGTSNGDLRHLMVQVILSQGVDRYPTNKNCNKSDKDCFCVLPCCYDALVVHGMLRVILSPEMESISIPDNPQNVPFRSFNSPAGFTGFYPPFSTSSLVGELTKMVVEKGKNVPSQYGFKDISVPIKSLKFGVHIDSGSELSKQDSLAQLCKENRSTELDFYANYLMDEVFSKVRQEDEDIPVQDATDEPLNAMAMLRTLFSTVRLHGGFKFLTELTLNNLVFRPRGYQHHRCEIQYYASQLFASIGKCCPVLQKLDLHRVRGLMTETLLFLFFWDAAVSMHVSKYAYPYKNVIVEDGKACMCIEDYDMNKIAKHGEDLSYCPMCHDDWYDNMIRSNHTYKTTPTYIIPDKEYNYMETNLLDDFKDLLLSSVKASDLCKAPFEDSIHLKRPKGPLPWEEGFKLPENVKEYSDAVGHDEESYWVLDSKFYVPEKYEYERCETDDRGMFDVNPCLMAHMEEFLLPENDQCQVLIPFLLVHMANLKRLGPKMDFAGALKTVREADANAFQDFKDCVFENIESIHLALDILVIEERTRTAVEENILNSVPEEAEEAVNNYLINRRPFKFELQSVLAKHVCDTLKDALHYFPNIKELSISGGTKLGQVPLPMFIWSALKNFKKLETLRVMTGNNQLNSVIISGCGERLKHLETEIAHSSEPIGVVTSFYLDDILRSQPNLASLELSTSVIHKSTVKTLSPQTVFPHNLTKFVVDNNVKWELFVKMWSECPNLEEFSVYVGQVAVAKFEYLDPFAEDPDFVDDEPVNPSVTVKMIDQLLNKRKLHQKLSKLRLGDTAQFRIHARALINLMEAMPNLRSLESVSVVTRIIEFEDLVEPLKDLFAWKKYYLRRLNNSFNRDPATALRCLWRWDSNRHNRDLWLGRDGDDPLAVARILLDAMKDISGDLDVFPEPISFLIDFAMPKVEGRRDD